LSRPSYDTREKQRQTEPSDTTGNRTCRYAEIRESGNPDQRTCRYADVRVRICGYADKRVVVFGYAGMRITGRARRHQRGLDEKRKDRQHRVKPLEVGLPLTPYLRQRGGGDRERKGCEVEKRVWCRGGGVRG